MHPIDTFFQQGKKSAQQEKDFIDLLIAGGGPVHGEGAQANQRQPRVDVYVPSRPVVTAQDEAARHAEKIAAIQQEISALDKSMAKTLEKTKQQNVVDHQNAKASMAKALAEAIKEKQRLQAEFANMAAQAEQKYERDAKAIDDLRESDIQDFNALASTGAPAAPPPARQHRSLATHLVTRVTLRPGWYAEADNVIRWLEGRGVQAKHANGEDFWDDLRGPDRPRPLLRASEAQLLSLHIALSTAPAAAWPSMRERIARILGTHTTNLPEA